MIFYIFDYFVFNIIKGIYDLLLLLLLLINN